MCSSSQAHEEVVSTDYLPLVDAREYDDRRDLHPLRCTAVVDLLVATSCQNRVTRVVETIADGETYLQVGDRVVSQFDCNWGGLAEYALVKTSHCAKNPPTSLSSAEVAATASSGAAAVILSRYIKRGDRVLVIGGSGGVGSFLVQLARTKGASFVAAVSTQTELMLELGVDKAIDYREEDVWVSDEFRSDTGRFDVVFDLVEKGWDRVTSKEGRARPIVKTGWEGGRFVTTVRERGFDDAHLQRLVDFIS